MFAVADAVAILGMIFPEPQAGLISGMLFGAKASLPSDLYQDLLQTGTVHIVALSGTNISFLLVTVGTVLSRVVSRRVALVTSVCLIWSFVGFVGFSPSVVRAALMGSLSLIGIYFGRSVWSLWIWGITCISMIVVSPPLITSISFQLSAFSTLGLLVFGSSSANQMHANVTASVSSTVCKEVPKTPMLGPLWLHDTTRAIYKGIIETLRLTMCAQVCTIPIIFWHFREVSIISPVSNVLIGWTVGPIMMTGFTSFGLGLLHPYLGLLPGSITYVLASYLIYVVQWTASCPWSHISL